MPIRKQEFYEGAALHILARSGAVTSLVVDPPFVRLNSAVAALLKYSTRGRSPWGFTFTPDEQSLLQSEAIERRTILGLVCGSDGVVGLEYSSFTQIASVRQVALRVSCFRLHGEHYEVSGPDGVLGRKVAPSAWSRILEAGQI